MTGRPRCEQSLTHADNERLTWRCRSVTIHPPKQENPATGRRTVKFIHTADWQIGKPYARFADPHKRALVQQARFDAIRRIGEVAQETKAAFVLVAGDLFDSPSADKTTVSAACSAIGQIPVPVFAIPGNHDHGGPGSLWQQDFFRREQAALAPNLTILLEEGPLELDSAILLPCPLLHRTTVLDPTAWLRSEDLLRALPDRKPRIVLAHGATQTFTSTWEDDEESASAANQIDLDRLPEAEIDYVALGDWHGARQVGPKAWYAGTPEIDRFPKGGGHDPGNILLVETRRGEPPIVTRRSTGRIRWHELDFDFTGDTAVDELESRLQTLLGPRTNEDLLKLALSGSIGIESRGKLEQLLETLGARLLRIKLDDRTHIAPTDEEIEAITQRRGDPLIARVARKLVDLSSGSGEEAVIARLALRELHAACSREATP